MLLVPSDSQVGYNIPQEYQELSEVLRIGGLNIFWQCSELPETSLWPPRKAGSILKEAPRLLQQVCLLSTEERWK
jgi:hypothetical protein